MTQTENNQKVWDLLKGLRGIEPLKQLLWSEVNYQRVNQPLSRRRWSDIPPKALWRLYGLTKDEIKIVEEGGKRMIIITQFKNGQVSHG